MTIASILSNYITVGLVVSFLITVLHHTRQENISFLVALSCTIFWPKVIATILTSYYGIE
jgi:hypothetical protein